jgi:hypothetical protein
VERMSRVCGVVSGVACGVACGVTSVVFSTTGAEVGILPIVSRWQICAVLRGRHVVLFDLKNGALMKKDLPARWSRTTPQRSPSREATGLIEPIRQKEGVLRQTATGEVRGLPACRVGSDRCDAIHVQDELAAISPAAGTHLPVLGRHALGEVLDSRAERRVMKDGLESPQFFELSQALLRSLVEKGFHKSEV